MSEACHSLPFETVWWQMWCYGLFQMWWQVPIRCKVVCRPFAPTWECDQQPSPAIQVALESETQRRGGGDWSWWRRWGRRGRWRPWQRRWRRRQQVWGGYRIKQPEQTRPKEASQPITRAHPEVQHSEEPCTPGDVELPRVRGGGQVARPFHSAFCWWQDRRSTWRPSEEFNLQGQGHDRCWGVGKVIGGGRYWEEQRPEGPHQVCCKVEICPGWEGEDQPRFWLEPSLNRSRIAADEPPTPVSTHAIFFHSSQSATSWCARRRG